MSKEIVKDPLSPANAAKLEEQVKDVSKAALVHHTAMQQDELKVIIQERDLLYKENEILKELANMEKKHQENKIVAKIKKHLKFFDRILYNIHIRIEKRLKKRIEVKFPITIDDDIKVCVYGDEYVL